MIQFTDKQAADMIRTLRKAYSIASSDRCRNSILNSMMRVVSMLERKRRRNGKKKA